MSKRIFLFSSIIVATCIKAQAQFTFSGSVVNGKNNEPLVGATININSTIIKPTNSEGNFVFNNLGKGFYVVNISNIGFQKQIDTIELIDNLSKNFILIESSYELTEMQVEGTRTSTNTGFATSTVTKQELEKRNLGQDLPYLLNQTTSLVTTSDAGGGVGYTSFRIRGTDASRINVTVNGIPTNDAESQGTYWVDFPDLASSVNSIQIQRGVGTSTNGAGAFGGSVNVQTSSFNAKHVVELANSFGSFNTLKNTINLSTGLLNEHFVFDARLSNIQSDGYIQRAISSLQSYYLSGAYYGKKGVLKCITFSGKEKTYQAWYGVPQDSLISNRTLNPAGMYYSPSGSLNYYANETDNYKQDNYQLHYSHYFNSSWSGNISVHYTKGKGYYEEYLQNQSFSLYNVADLVVNSTTIFSSDLVRRRWLDNDFYGAVYSLKYNHKKWNVLLGGATNQYYGRQFGEIIWAQYAGNISSQEEYYRTHSLKNDVSNYAKISYSITDKLSAFVDIQHRQVNYTFLGFDEFLLPKEQQVILNFINPKAAINYSLNTKNNVYCSYAKGNKEPSRDDYVQSSSSSRPSPESVDDIELGYKRSGITQSFLINAYYMNYTNQLVLTGAVNDVGNYNRTNVASSHREGIELEYGVNLTKKISWNINGTFSKNKIKSIVLFIDDYDNGGQVATTFTNTDIAFSPSITAGSQINYTVLKNFQLGLDTKYVGKQYLDNTSDSNKQLLPYLVNNLRFSYSIYGKQVKEIKFQFAINNILNEKYESNGYTYSYVFGGAVVNSNYYFPQAPINYQLGIVAKF